MQQQNICYTCIAQKKVTLIEVGDERFHKLVAKLIEEVSGVNQFKSYVYEDWCYNCICEGDYTYICVAQKDFPNRISFGFLHKVKENFQPSAASRFHNYIEEEMEKYSNEKDVDKISMVKEQLEQVQKIMKENLESVFERDDKLKILDSKTEQLNINSTNFKKRTEDLKNVMCRKNLRMTLIIVSVIVIIILIIVFAACGITFSNCRPSPTPTPNNSSATVFKPNINLK